MCMLEVVREDRSPLSQWDAGVLVSVGMQEFTGRSLGMTVS